MKALKKKNSVTGRKVTKRLLSKGSRSLLDEVTFEQVSQCSQGSIQIPWASDRRAFLVEGTAEAKVPLVWAECFLQPPVRLPERNIKDPWEGQTSLVIVNSYKHLFWFSFWHGFTFLWSPQKMSICISLVVTALLGYSQGLLGLITLVWCVSTWWTEIPSPAEIGWLDRWS